MVASGVGASEDEQRGKRAEMASTRPMIQTLALEVLTEIFLHCLPSYHDELSTRDGSQPPLLLGRVCSRWRMVSISSQKLWSSFAILGSDLSQGDCKKELEATKLWIRSQRFPQLLELLASQSWRWKVIEIMTLPAELDGIILAPFRTGHLPQLEDFFSTITGFHDGNVVHSLALSSAPHLQGFHHVGGYGVRIDRVVSR
ncbi:hypothetical protein BD410DRAFT_793638 [Rickenella mellea]|uniref:F-box domain-containing protein n=1 Tax=Rickenella mellea TaxID=50990 RepID=A0A4Y7PSU1_9AGAM|nr:hypothetical protein BD410DRAFT_793638 [Rickenella mellea]